MGLLAQLIRAVTRQEPVESGVVFALPFPSASGSLAEKAAWRQVAELENAIRERLAESKLGELCGHDVALDGQELRVFVCGPDPEALFDALCPAVVAAPAGSYALLRYSAQGVPTRIMLQ